MSNPFDLHRGQETTPVLGEVHMVMPEINISRALSMDPYRSITFTRTFAASHRLQDYPGNCRRIHGHNYKATIEIQADEVNTQGFIVEFALVKQVIDDLDHRLILEDSDPLREVLMDSTIGGSDVSDEWFYLVPLPPTTENLATYLAETILKAVKYDNPQASFVSVEVVLAETDSITATGSASFDADDDGGEDDASGPDDDQGFGIDDSGISYAGPVRSGVRGVPRGYYPGQ